MTGPAAAGATRPNGPKRARHWGGFVAAGVAALIVDLSILNGLLAMSVPALLARPISIAVAMVVSWWINRTITFAVTAPPSVSEFARFAGVSWVAQAINYAVFAALLLSFPAISASAAVIVASAVSMVAAYAGFRFGVFRGADGLPGAARQ